MGLCSVHGQHASALRGHKSSSLPSFKVASSSCIQGQTLFKQQPLCPSSWHTRRLVVQATDKDGVDVNSGDANQAASAKEQQVSSSVPKERDSVIPIAVGIAFAGYVLISILVYIDAYM